MGAYQILATVAAILSLITTIGMTVAGWIVSGERAKRTKVESEIDEMKRHMQAMQLEMAREYVRSPQLENVLQQIRGEIGAMNENMRIALGSIQKLEIQVAKISATHMGI